MGTGRSSSRLYRYTLIVRGAFCNCSDTDIPIKIVKVVRAELGRRVVAYGLVQGVYAEGGDLLAAAGWLAGS